MSPRYGWMAQQLKNSDFSQFVTDYSIRITLDELIPWIRWINLKWKLIFDEDGVTLINTGSRETLSTLVKFPEIPHEPFHP